MQLPTVASVDEAWTVALWSGCIAVAGQLVFVLLLRQSRNRAVASHAGLGAHQIVAFGYMVLAAIIGVNGWWLGGVEEPPHSKSRMLDTVGTSRWLAAVLGGELLFWDLPCGFIVYELRNWDSLLHHFCMLGVTYVVILLPNYYGLYYLGAIELSSIPLQLNDYCRLNHDAIRGTDAIPPLAKLNEWNNLLTAVAFVVVRLISFTHVTIFQCIPDTIHSIYALSHEHYIKMPGDFERQATLWFMLIFLFFFEGLQLFWGYMHGRSQIKLMRKAKEAKAAKEAEAEPLLPIGSPTRSKGGYRNLAD
jgi:hypothetical protein